jgi:hypothetical protein
VTQRSSVTTSVGGEVASGRKKGGYDVSWVNTNLNGPKNEKKYVINSAATNG